MSTANDRLYAEDGCSSWRIKQDGHAARYDDEIEGLVCTNRIWGAKKPRHFQALVDSVETIYRRLCRALRFGDMQKACYITQQLEQDNMAYWIDDATYQTKEKGSW